MYDSSSLLFALRWVFVVTYPDLYDFPFVLRTSTTHGLKVTVLLYLCLSLKRDITHRTLVNTEASIQFALYILKEEIHIYINIYIHRYIQILY